MDQPEQTPPVEAEEPFQFELRTLFLVMFLFAAFCGFVSGFLLEWALFYWSLCLLLTGIVLACRRERRQLGKQMIGVGIVLATPLGATLPIVGASRASLKRSSCINRMHGVQLALQGYHSVHGSFPPAYIADESGRPMHSWRVLILPELGAQDLYDKYSFDEPWDGPNNSKLHAQIMSLYRCPADEPSANKTETNYVVVVGPRTMFPGEDPVKQSDIHDGTSNTIMIVEVANSGIHWMEPRDLHVLQMAPAVNPAAGQGISADHLGAAHAVFADGSMHRLNEERLTPKKLDALLSRDGGEEVEWPEF